MVGERGGRSFRAGRESAGLTQLDSRVTAGPLDASPGSWAAYEAVLDGMDGPSRLQAAVELSEAVREIRLAGIQARFPELTRRQAVARFVLEAHGVTLPAAL